MSSSRAISKITKLKYIKNFDPKVPKGEIIFDMNEEDVKDINEEQENENIDDDIMDKASKLAMAGATVEYTFKAGAVAKAYAEGDVTFEKLKSKLGVSGSNASYHDVNNMLEEAIGDAQEQEELLNKIDEEKKAKGKANVEESEDEEDEESDESDESEDDE
ncbi:nucleoplasmin-like protein ANO39 [Chenopodium quinoa]|uniref:nucleoplasmin-like protein ANO39 n=1 Tax=Chenopodium quinoa TaxID=63459 RepID=UPI000B770936|nr:nucleoplasmin-like protein ANO39 [Chenopodium quinoa]